MHPHSVHFIESLTDRLQVLQDDKITDLAGHEGKIKFQRINYSNNGIKSLEHSGHRLPQF